MNFELTQIYVRVCENLEFLLQTLEVPVNTETDQKRYGDTRPGPQ